jgi:membrane protein implicated in regulation of membrane protease activity
MLLLLALLLLIVLPAPWNVVGPLAIGAVGTFEVAYWHRRVRGTKVQTGAENLLGSVGEVTQPLMPVGQIRVLGELWQARSNAELPRGTTVRVVALSGLTVEVEAAQYEPSAM